MASLVHAAADRERARSGQPVLPVRGRARRRGRRHRRLPGGAGVGRDPRRPRSDLNRHDRLRNGSCGPPRVDRPARPLRSRALRRTRLSRRRVDAAAGRGAGRVVRARGLRAVLGDHQARRHPRRRVAAGAVLERARPDDRTERRARASRWRWSSPSIRRATARCGASPCAASRPGDPVAPRRDRSHRARGARRHRPRPPAATSSTSWSTSPRRSRSR